MCCYVFGLMGSLCFGEVDLQTPLDKITVSYIVKPLGWTMLFFCFVTIILFFIFTNILASLSAKDLKEFKKTIPEVQKQFIVDKARERYIAELDIKEKNPADYEIYEMQVKKAEEQGLIKEEFMVSDVVMGDIRKEVDVERAAALEAKLAARRARGSIQ